MSLPEEQGSPFRYSITGAWPPSPPAPPSPPVPVELPSEVVAVVLLLPPPVDPEVTPEPPAPAKPPVASASSPEHAAAKESVSTTRRKLFDMRQASLAYVALLKT